VNQSPDTVSDETRTPDSPPPPPPPVDPTEAGWIAGPAVPSEAAPLCAVDLWRAEPDGDGLRGAARLSVRGEEPNLRGHFPGFPVLPGVFVIEALSQVMGLALPQQAPRLRVLRSVRFLAPLLDGDELTVEFTAAAQEGGDWEVTGRGLRADGVEAARIRARFAPGEAARA